MKQLLLFIAILIHCNILSADKYAPSNNSTLKSEVENIIDNSEICCAYIGICIQDISTGQILFDKNKARHFTPASVVKLFTTALALNTLGEDYFFETKIYTNGPVSNEGIIHGDLFLSGSGDPSLKFSSLNKLVLQLKKKGIHTIEGQILVDKTLNEMDRKIPHTEWDDLMWYYSPEVDFLCLDKNQVKITVGSYGEEGTLAKIQLNQKIPYYDLISQVTIDASSNTPSVNIQRDIKNNQIILTGTIPKKHDEITEKITVHNPSEYTRQCFISLLKKNGIGIKQGVSSQNLNCHSEVARINSPPLKDLIRSMNKSSNNLFAEEIFYKAKSTGLKHQKSMNNFLSGVSTDYKEYTLSDGSGMSRQNLVSPYFITQLLSFMKNTKHYKSFVDSLPIAGIDGSLKNRFKDTIGEKNIIAKTGTMTNISSLAGYATTKSGKKISFAIFVNNANTKTPLIRKAIDEALVYLLESL